MNQRNRKKIAQALSRVMLVTLACNHKDVTPVQAMEEITKVLMTINHINPNE